MNDRFNFPIFLRRPCSRWHLAKYHNQVNIPIIGQYLVPFWNSRDFPFRILYKQAFDYLSAWNLLDPWVKSCRSQSSTQDNSSQTYRRRQHNNGKKKLVTIHITTIKIHCPVFAPFFLSFSLLLTQAHYVEGARSWILLCTSTLLANPLSFLVIKKKNPLAALKSSKRGPTLRG